MNLGRLKNNFHRLRRHAGRKELLLVLKSNAYGHSLVKVAQALEKEKTGLHGFAVANVEEGIELRRARIKKPIYILSGIQTWDEDLFRCLRFCKLTPVISSLETLRSVAQFSAKRKVDIRFHLKFNTGMNRLGIEPDQLTELFDLLGHSRRLRVEGLASHFAQGERPKSKISQRQVRSFLHILERFEENSISAKYIHMENSSGFLNRLLPQGNLARIGLHLFGIENQRLSPVAKWTAQIYQTRELKKNDSVGYGNHFRAPRRMRMAVLGVGYADGYPRILSNRAHVLVRGIRCKVLGAVSMDLTAIDISNVPNLDLARDRAVLLGESGREIIRAEDLASLAETIPWEIMTGISERVPRVFSR